MAVKVLYTAHAVATGGREGHTQSDDGLINVDLSIPKAMEEIPAKVQKSIKFHFVEDMLEVLKLALETKGKKKG
jgi:hypothetical protein